MIIKADFHNHSCLSPCGDLALSPKVIVKTLVSRGIQLAALTDHNSALNCPAFKQAAKTEGLAVLFGLEVQSQEECHILCLFSKLEQALDFGDEVYTRLPPVMNNPDKMGDQVYVDDEENIIGEVDKYLINSVDLGIDELAAWVHDNQGLVIPAHVDRPAFSFSSQLGFIPKGSWDALEVIRIPPSIETLGYPLITSSDAHYIEHIARRPFDLDLQNDMLINASGEVDLLTIKKALQRRALARE